MQHQEKTALSRQALGGLIPIVTFVALPHNRAQIKQASNQMKKVALKGKLGEGFHTLVSDDDYPLVSRATWRLSKGGYVVGSGGLLLHRLLTNCPTGKEVDHRNGDKLDNQRNNLRVCTPAENSRNRSFAPVKSPTGYRGVVWRNGVYKAQIKFNYINRQLGKFESAEAAARAYDTAAIELHGEFASLNFPLDA